MTSRAVPIATVVVATVLLLAGCRSGGGSPSGTGSGSPSVHKPVVNPAPVPVPTKITVPAAAACTRDSLKITYQGTDNTAGHFHGVLTFTNTGTAPCSMKGYPIVFMGQEEAEGTQGAASTNDTSSSPALVTVAPGAAAHAAATITDAGVVCEPVDTSYLVASPPLTVPFDESTNGEHVYNVNVQACSDDSISLIQVGPITS